MKTPLYFLLALCALSASAKDVKLVWTESPDTNVFDYVVNYTDGVTTNSVDVGNVTTTILTGLMPSTPYSFWITSSDVVGTPSDPSNVLGYATPMQLSLGTWPAVSLPALQSSNLVALDGTNVAQCLSNGCIQTNLILVIPDASGSTFYRFATPSPDNEEATGLIWTDQQP